MVATVYMIDERDVTKITEMYEDFDRAITSLVSHQVNGMAKKLPEIQKSISNFFDKQIKLGVIDDADAMINYISDKYELVISNKYLNEAIANIKEENITTMLKAALLNDKAIAIDMGNYNIP